VLDTIGAGATASATTRTDWYDVWLRSPEASALQERIAQIHANGHTQPAITAECHTQFATSWFYQATVLTKRNFVAYWRNPMYLLAKIILNIVSGLLIGFSFFQAKDSLQGMQNKLFVCFFVTDLQVMRSCQCRPFSCQSFSVFLRRSNCKRFTLIFAPSTKFASVRAECTHGRHSLRRKS